MADPIELLFLRIDLFMLFRPDRLNDGVKSSICHFEQETFAVVWDQRGDEVMLGVEVGFDG